MKLHSARICHGKMRRPLHGIQLMQVIRHHTRLMEAIRQRFQRINTIIHSGKQHTLIQQGDPFTPPLRITSRISGRDASHSSD